ncbi:MAG: NADPH:quinone oxidoreductase [Coxiellaceae bacterium]|nr:NADPH:quinone oxidoreductase [Coxiellaceae bacterium]
MKAWVCHRIGSIDDCHQIEVATPSLKSHQIIIEVYAAALNFPDVLKVLGKHQSSLTPPFILGHEGSGIVKAVGSDVMDFKPGDRVMFICSGSLGAFADYIAIDAHQVTIIPDTMSLELASCLPLTFGTAYLACVANAKITPSDEVLILGAAGGLGLACLELVKHIGCRVVCAVSSNERAQLCRSRGADDVVVYDDTIDSQEKRKQLTHQLISASHGHGFDVIIDPVGGGHTESALRSIFPQGRYIVLGFAAGSIPSIALNLVLLKECSLSGVYFTNYYQRHPQELSEHQQALVELVSSSQLVQFHSQQCLLPELKSALIAMSDRRLIGKMIVIK